MPIPRFMPDTNCIVALLSPRHDHHERALGEMERRLDNGETLVVPRILWWKPTPS